MRQIHKNNEEKEKKRKKRKGVLLDFDSRWISLFRFHSKFF